MQDHPEFFEDHVEKNRTWYTILTRGILSVVTGADTLFTLIKQYCTWRLHFTKGINSVLRTADFYKSGKSAYFAGPIIIGSIIGAPIFLASAAVEEYERYKNEKERIEQARLLGLEVKFVNDGLNTKLTGKLNGVDFSLRDDGQYGLNNDQLLIYILHQYLQAHDLHDLVGEKFRESLVEKRGNKGYLPGQEGMIRLLEKALSHYSRTTVTRVDPYFPDKVNTYINTIQKQATNLTWPEGFSGKVVAALSLGEVAPFEVPIDPVIKKKQSKILRAVKNIMQFLQRNNTAMAMVTGVAIIAGLAISWPVFIVAIIVGPLAGIAGILYSRYITKINKRKAIEVNRTIEHDKTRHDLLYKVNSLQGKQYQYDKQPVKENAGPPEALIALPEIDRAIKARLIIHTIAQWGYWLSIGLVVGIAIMCTICLLAPLILPAIPLVGLPLFATSFTWTGLAAGLMGIVYGLRYGFKNAKDYLTKEGQAEVDRIRVVHSRVENCRRRVGDKAFDPLFKYSKEQLVAELLRAYNEFSRQKKATYNKVQRQIDGAADKALEDVLARKEMILLRLEEVTGIRRDRDSVTGLPQNQTADFYNKLSLFLQEDKSLAPDANRLLTEFKTEILDVKSSVEAHPRTGWFSSINKHNLFSLNRKANKYIFPAAGAACIALVLGAMLFGPGAVVAFSLVAVAVAGFFVAQKICEYKAAKNLEKLSDTEMKVSLIETICKAEKSTAKLAQVKDSQKGAIPSTPGGSREPLFSLEENNSNGQGALRKEGRPSSGFFSGFGYNQAANHNERPGGGEESLGIDLFDPGIAVGGISN